MGVRRVRKFRKYGRVWGSIMERVWDWGSMEKRQSVRPPRLGVSATPPHTHRPHTPPPPLPQPTRTDRPAVTTPDSPSPSERSARYRHVANSTE